MRVALGSLLLLQFAFCSALAEPVLTPTSLEGGRIIGAKAVKDLIARGGSSFFDTRSPVNYGKGHIPTAIALPYYQRSAKVSDFDASGDSVNLDRLPAEKRARIIFYSHGDTGWKSYKASVLAIRAGYTNVSWFRLGYADWSQKRYPVER